jgi:hypothetical protein
MRNFKKFVQVLCVLAGTLCFTAAAFAGTEEIFEVINAFTENFQKERDSWETVTVEEFKNSAYGTFEKFTLLKKNGSAAVFLEARGNDDGTGQPWEKSFLCNYDTVDFGGVVEGLSPGMSPEKAEKLFGGEGAEEANAMSWEDDEAGNAVVTLVFEDGAAVMLSFVSFPDGGGEDEAAMERLYSKYGDLKKSLSAK